MDAFGVHRSVGSWVAIEARGGSSAASCLAIALPSIGLSQPHSHSEIGNGQILGRRHGDALAGSLSSLRVVLLFFVRGFQRGIFRPAALAEW